MTLERPRALRAAYLLSLSGILWADAATPVAAQQNILAETSVRVDSIVVIGNRRHSSSTIITRTGLRPGNIVRQPQIQDAIRRLFSSGDFSNIEVGVGGTDQERGTFYFLVEERPYITQYQFAGLQRVDEGMIRDTKRSQLDYLRQVQMEYQQKQLLLQLQGL